MSFGKDVATFHVNSIKEADDIRKGVTLELFNSVIKDTPVDTGRAKGNWQSSENKPASTEIERTSESASLAEAQSVALSSKPDSETYLSNNLPYISELEYGSSKQAPEGMVRKNMARIQSILRSFKRKK